MRVLPKVMVDILSLHGRPTAFTVLWSAPMHDDFMVVSRIPGISYRAAEGFPGVFNMVLSGALLMVF